MKNVRRTEVDTFDIFNFAEKKYKIYWNVCCDLFQGKNRILPFNGTREFYLGDVEGEIEACGNDKQNKDYKLAYEILRAFMKKHKLKKMFFVDR